MIRFIINNPNSRSISTIEVYRELTGVPIPDSPTEPPLQVLSGFTDSVIDYTAVVGNTYDYRFRVIRNNGDSVMSPVITFKAVSLYGPGGWAEPKYDGNGITLVDTVPDTAGLPTLADLQELGNGGVIGNYAWTGNWHKIKVANVIYFTPEKGYIEIDPSRYQDFVASLVSPANIIIGDYTYNFVRDIAYRDAIKSLFDGRTVTRYPLPADYPRESICGAIAKKVGINSTDVYVVTSASSISNSYYYYSDNDLLPSRTRNGQLSPNDGKRIFWKPVIKFKQESGKV